MYLKSAALTSLFALLSIGSYYAATTPLVSTSVDEEFYQDLNLLSRFDEKSIGYGNEIEEDHLDIRNYLFNTSFNLTWTKKNEKINENSVTGNAFLLNVLTPDWMDDLHPDRKNYSPKSYVAGDDVVLLLGTSFSFAKQLFDKVNDWKTEVNEKNNTTTVNLKNCSNSGSEYSLLFSHPWPTLRENNPKFHQNHLYQLLNTSYSAFDGDIQEPYYFSVKPDDVEAVYAAVDLSLNKKLINFSLGVKEKMLFDLHMIHRQDNSKVEWVEGIDDIYGRKYKFAVDFAVIKVKFPVNNLRGKFLDYIIDLYRKRIILPKVMDSYFDVKNERIGPMFLGGWESLTEQEADFHLMDNLFVQKKASSKKTGQETELELYESYLYTQSSNPTPTTDYEIVDKKWYENKEDGVLFLKYRIKNKTKNWTSPKIREFLLVEDNQSNKSGGSSSAEMLKQWQRDKIAEDRKLLSFLESQPKVHARWREHGIKNAYFPFKNVQSDLWAQTIINPREKKLNQNSTASVFQISNQKYINLAHHLDLPNMYLHEGKGMGVFMQHPWRREKVMMGIYDGTSDWVNPVYGQKKHVGKVALLISPWRYDLFNSNNNLSKPSLGEVLKKKNLHNRLIQTNRFRV